MSASNALAAASTKEASVISIDMNINLRVLGKVEIEDNLMSLQNDIFEDCTQILKV